MGIPSANRYVARELVQARCLAGPAGAPASIQRVADRGLPQRGTARTRNGRRRCVPADIGEAVDRSLRATRSSALPPGSCSHGYAPTTAATSPPRSPMPSSRARRCASTRDMPLRHWRRAMKRGARTSHSASRPKARGTHEGGAIRDDFLTFGRPDIGEEEIAEVVDTLRSGWLATGPAGGALRGAVRRATSGRAHAVAVGSCTAALHFARRLPAWAQGDEVITTPMTFCATAHAIVHAGAPAGVRRRRAGTRATSTPTRSRPPWARARRRSCRSTRGPALRDGPDRGASAAAHGLLRRRGRGARRRRPPGSGRSAGSLGEARAASASTRPRHRHRRGRDGHDRRRRAGGPSPAATPTTASASARGSATRRAAYRHQQARRPRVQVQHDRRPGRARHPPARHGSTSELAAPGARSGTATTRRWPSSRWSRPPPRSRRRARAPALLAAGRPERPGEPRRRARRADRARDRRRGALRRRCTCTPTTARRFGHREGELPNAERDRRRARCRCRCRRPLEEDARRGRRRCERDVGGRRRGRRGMSGGTASGPTVAHVNYSFFHSTQSFIYHYLVALRRCQSICLTREPGVRGDPGRGAATPSSGDLYTLRPGRRVARPVVGGRCRAAAC